MMNLAQNRSRRSVTFGVQTNGIDFTATVIVTVICVRINKRELTIHDTSRSIKLSRHLISSTFQSSLSISFEIQNTLPRESAENGANETQSFSKTLSQSSKEICK
jgi:hypothetical protein